MPRPTAAAPTTILHNLPDPTLAFTIPSIHDESTTLECRIYHPTSLSPRSSIPGPNPPWRKHAAIVAHPYAPLGGSYDDPVVETLSATLLTQGFIVGTFNFRGAGHSTARTSWTGRGERADYMSFVGFVYYYLHYLDPPFQPQQGLTTTANENMPPADTQQEGAAPPPPVLLLGGYSYGAMITTLLPPLVTILAPFATPKTASAAADIRLRAQHLAEKQNTILASARAAAVLEPTSPRGAKAAFGGRGAPLRVGGDEDIRRSQEHSHRRSFSLEHNHRRSFSLEDAEDKIRKGVAELMCKAKKGHHHHHHRGKSREYDRMAAVREEEESTTDEERHKEKEPDSLAPVRELVAPRVGYLLVSPPVGWATHLMTMNLGGFLWLGKRAKSSLPKTKDPAESTDAKEASAETQKLIDNPTLAIYGDTDVFVGVKKYRDWASKLQAGAAGPGGSSRFRAHEISTAGHFYIEEGTLLRVAEAVRAFAGELVATS